MAKSKSSSRAVRAPNRRGSPEAIEKRRAARLFNDVLAGQGGAGRLDGRTEKRRQRLLHELEAGLARGSRELKPLDVLTRVQELLELGENLSTIRKVAKVRKLAVAPELVAEVVTRLHRAYGFRPEAYRFVGIDDDILRAAGVIEVRASSHASARTSASASTSNANANASSPSTSARRIEPVSRVRKP